MQFIVEAKLKELECPLLFSQSHEFCALFLVLQIGVFEHLGEAVDTELHSLIKSVPEILLSQYVADSYNVFTDNLEDGQVEMPNSGITLEELQSKIDRE